MFLIMKEMNKQLVYNFALHLMGILDNLLQLEIFITQPNLKTLEAEKKAHITTMQF